METDTFVPTRKQFTPIFNKVGDDVWTQWDKYVQDQVDDGMYIRRSKHTKYSQQKGDEDDGSSHKVIADKSVPWPLNHDEDGYPTLPDMVGKSLADVKDIIRSFVTLSYRMLIAV